MPVDLETLPYVQVVARRRPVFKLRSPKLNHCFSADSEGEIYCSTKYESLPFNTEPDVATENGSLEYWMRGKSM